MKIKFKGRRNRSGGAGSVTPAQMKVLVKAQRGEADAALMYRCLAFVVKGHKDRSAFRRLAKDEARHAAVFARLTGRKIKAKPTKAILIPLMYLLAGKKRIYPLIAKAEYAAADKYQHVVPDFPDVEKVMNDEVHHGDAVKHLLEK